MSPVTLAELSPEVQARVLEQIEGLGDATADPTQTSNLEISNRAALIQRLMAHFSIVKDHPSLLKYVECLQAKNSDSLGFLPRLVFEQRAEAGQLFLGLLNGEPAGYILAGTGFQGVMRCVQVAIQYDARRRLYGAMLVAAVEQYGEECGCSRISLRCGSDLPANEFWQSLGYTLSSTEESGAGRRQRRDHINVWSKSLSPAVVATTWKNGRPRIYASNADRLRAWRERQRNVAVAKERS